jgi:hypothetical protein
MLLQFQLYSPMQKSFRLQLTLPTSKKNTSPAPPLNHKTLTGIPAACLNTHKVQQHSYISRPAQTPNFQNKLFSSSTKSQYTHWGIPAPSTHKVQSHKLLTPFQLHQVTNTHWGIPAPSSTHKVQQCKLPPPSSSTNPHNTHWKFQLSQHTKPQQQQQQKLIR